MKINFWHELENNNLSIKKTIMFGKLKILISQDYMKKLLINRSINFNYIFFNSFFSFFYIILLPFFIGLFIAYLLESYS